MPKCTILVGVPASGKSTWVQEHMPMANVMSTDIVIKNVARSYGMTYDEGFKELISFAEKVMWRHITWSFAEQVDFVIDRTNLSVKSRRKLIEMLKLHRYEIECVVFPMPGTEKLSQEEWNRRLNSRKGKFIPAEVLKKMQDSYEMPLHSEGFDNIIFI
jgi:predicted kinase